MAAGGTIERGRRGTQPEGREAIVQVMDRRGHRVVCTSGNGRLRSALPELLERLGMSVLVVPTLGETTKKVEGLSVDVCVLDLTSERTLPASVRLLRAQRPRLPIVGLIDPVDALLAGDAVQAGIYDVLPWPCEEHDLALAVANAAERAPIRPLGGQVEATDPLFAQSPAMREALDLARAVAATRSAVVICGEPGTGRSLLARTIHRWSGGDQEAPFVAFDCAGAEAADVERGLFGAVQDRKAGGNSAIASLRVGRGGAVMRARGGTLFLEHVVELPARMQGALARLLRDREAAVGERPEVVDVEFRAITALGSELDSQVVDGRLREELFERLAQSRIEAPPLRRRREDVPPLAAWLLARLCDSARESPKAFSRSALALLSALPWHGNVEELRTLLGRLVRSVPRAVIQIDDLLEHTSLDGISTRLEAGVTLKDAKARFERECITAVLRRHHGRVGEAAKALGIQRTNLYRKVRQLNVSRSLLSARR